jgi:hypothetical protein
VDACLSCVYWSDNIIYVTQYVFVVIYSFSLFVSCRNSAASLECYPQTWPQEISSKFPLTRRRKEKREAIALRDASVAIAFNTRAGGSSSEEELIFRMGLAVPGEMSLTMMTSGIRSDRDSLIIVLWDCSSWCDSTHTVIIMFLFVLFSQH